MLALPDSSATYLPHFVSVMNLFPAQSHKYSVVSALKKEIKNMIQLIQILEPFIYAILSDFFWPGISNEQQYEANFLLQCFSLVNTGKKF